MKILFCNYEYPPLGGGGGVVMAALARELAQRHQVTVLTSRAMGLPARSEEGGVRILRVPVFFRRELAVANFPSMLAYVPMASVRGVLLGAGAFDVINTHFVVPTGPVGHLLGKLYRIPNVLSVHGGDLYDPSKGSSPHRHAWLRAPIRHLLKAADTLVGQSRNTLEHVAGIYGVQRPTELIPLGIERPPALRAGADRPDETLPETARPLETRPAAARPDADRPDEILPDTARPLVARPDAARRLGPRREFGLPDDAFVMVTVGRVVARKATSRLVEALKAAHRPNVHLLIVGDGPDAAAVRTAAAAANLADRVHFTGQVSEERKFQALAGADIFVSSSQHEGFGLVFLEAMAYRLPIICFDHGGQTDFLVNGETGFVVRLNDMDSFARGIRDLHDSQALREQMGRTNSTRVEDYFIDVCARRYETVFEQAVRAFKAAPITGAL
jgi:glycosyltransferase involved in cell wall biosynthesis